MTEYNAAISKPTGTAYHGFYTKPECVRYLITSSATAEWLGEDGQLTTFQDGAWAFHTPQTGWLVWIENEQALTLFDGTGWA